MSEQTNLIREQADTGQPRDKTNQIGTFGDLFLHLSAPHLSTIGHCAFLKRLVW